jgi:hypothetical protein
MDLFFFQLAIIFLPGLVWERISTRYALKRSPTQFEIALRTFTFGLAAYAITFMVYGVLGLDFMFPEIRRYAGFLERKFLNQFAVAIAVSLIGAIIWLYVINYKILGSLLRAIGATKSFGQEDVWDFVFNSPAAASEYVYVRDYDKQTVFSGWVRAFSESAETRELLLRDVQVFDLDRNLLYEVPLMYVARKRDDLNIEFPATGSDGRTI